MKNLRAYLVGSALAFVTSSLIAAPTPINSLTVGAALLAKATPDQCYSAIGEDPAGTAPDSCAAGSQPKVNEAYIWGLAKSGDQLFFGTVANTNCLVQGGYLQSTDPVETASYVCEFGQSALVRNGIPPLLPANTLPAALGDWRPPSLYRYDLTNDTLANLDLPPPLDPARGRLAQTIGIRAAGSLDGVVILAGPALSLGGGINLFAFDDNGAFIDSTNIPGYSNIRKSIVASGHLYFGVGTYRDISDGAPTQQSTGRILRWAGDAANPFIFEEVGVVSSSVAELVEHEGRIFVTTWPEPTSLTNGSNERAGLFMSPPIPGSGGLPSVPADDITWTSAWSVDDYEADALTAATYGGGALASFDGYLFWGTMHVPGLSTLVHGAARQTVCDAIVPPDASCDPTDTTALVLGSERAISIFRGQNFDTTPEINLLYGYAEMPVYNPITDTFTQTPNRLGDVPDFGTAGFNNPLNNYTWTMSVFDDRLWVGTMDWGWLIGLGDVADAAGLTPIQAAAAELVSTQLAGADLWYFVSGGSPALPESLAGVGNPSNYGIRTMLATEDSLYLGTANPMNLLVGLDGGLAGGWELIELTPLAVNTPVGSNVSVASDAGDVVYCEVNAEGVTRLVSVAGLLGGDVDAASLINAGLQALLAQGTFPDGVPLNQYSQYEEAFLLITSSDPSGAGCDGELAQVSIPYSQSRLDAKGVRLLQLTLSGTGPILEDITLASSGTDGQLVGGVRAGFTGLLFIFYDRPVPVFGAPLLGILVLLLAIFGGYRSYNRRPLN